MKSPISMIKKKTKLLLKARTFSPWGFSFEKFNNQINQRMSNRQPVIPAKQFFRSIFILLLTLPSLTTFAQHDHTTDAACSVFKLNFLMPGVSYEQRLSRQQTLYASGYINAHLFESDFNQYEFLLAPTLNIEFRTYYGIDRRLDRGRRTAMNTGGYLAPVYIGAYSLVSNEATREWVNRVGFVWGMQFNYPSHFSLDFNVGFAYTFGAQSSIYYSPVSIPVQLTLGFWLGREGGKG